jgi:acyl-CoA thioester hydrolase
MFNPDTPLPRDPVFSCAIRVFFYDTDAGGVVHNIAYLRWVEEGRTRLAEYLGWPLEKMLSGDVCPVVARTEIDYLRPGRLGDSLRIESRLIALRRASFDIQTDIFRVSANQPEQKLTHAIQRLACVRLAQGKPVPIPPAWRDQWPDLLLAAH